MSDEFSYDKFRIESVGFFREELLRSNWRMAEGLLVRLKRLRLEGLAAWLAGLRI